MRFSYVMIVATVGLGAFASGAATAGVADNGKCLVTGPYPKESGAQHVTGALRVYGLEGTTLRRPTMTLFHQVVLDGFIDAADADKAADRLRRGGLHDLLVYRSGTDRDPPSISLGVFRDLSHAVRRTEQAQLLGFDPQIRDEYLTEPLWYVEVAEPADATAFATATGTVPQSVNCRAGSPAASPEVTNASGTGDPAQTAVWNEVREIYGHLRLQIAQADKPPTR